MHPKLLTTPYFTIYTYGAMLALAYLSALWWLFRSARREGINRERISGLGLWVIIGAIAGAKVLMILRSLPYYMDYPSEFWSLGTLQSGGDFYGGFIGALTATVIFFARHRDLPRWKIADLCGPAIALGQAIGRVGCLMAGCCYGCETELPWGVTFTDPAAEKIVGTPLGIRLHPVQAYESVLCLLLFCALVWLSRRKRFEGQIILAYSLLYAIIRFFLEYVRGDVARGFLFDGLFSTSQFVALIVIVIGLPIFISRLKASSAVK
ncbi:MAG: prolipoprotein diacylglyceryl transferase [Acidobacteria bacterium]|nr:prolipoprotein diacylglyceryl transferase [Acidobacteriota bacterium]